ESSALLALLAAGSAASAFCAAFLLQLTFNFPERWTLVERFPRLELYIYLPTLLFNAPLAGTAVVLAHRAPERLFAAPFPLLHKISDVLFLLYILAGVLSFIFGYRRVSHTERRRLRVLLIATLIASVPLIVVQTLYLLNGSLHWPGFTITQS